MHEPTTALTDYALALLALVLGRRLWRAGAPGPAATRLWGASFLAVAVAAGLGGTRHAIAPDDAPSLRAALWLLAYTSVGIADVLLLAGAAREALREPARRGALALVGARLLIYVPLIAVTRDLRHVGYELGGTLLLTTLFGFDLLRRREPAARFVLGGALVSFAGGWVQAARLGLHERFNHNDVFHVIQMAGLAFFYRAGLLLRERWSGPSPGR